MILEFDDLVEKAKEDLEINHDNLIEVSARTGIDMVFYAEQRSRWNQQKSKREAELDKVYRYLWLYYTGKANASCLEYLKKKTPFKIQLNNKQDIEKFIESDTLYQEVKTTVQDAENAIKFLDEVIGAIRFRTQVVRNIIQEKTNLG